MAVTSACSALVLLCIGVLDAQTCLLFSPMAIRQDGTASIELFFYSSATERSAAIQWSLHVPLSGIRNITIEEGAALTSSGKRIVCSGRADTHRCIAAGEDARPLANGMIGRIIATLASDSGKPIVRISDPIAVSPDGYLMRIELRPKSLAVPELTRDCRLRPRTRQLTDIVKIP